LPFIIREHARRSTSISIFERCLQVIRTKKRKINIIS